MPTLISLMGTPVSRQGQENYRDPPAAGFLAGKRSRVATAPESRGETLADQFAATDRAALSTCFLDGAQTAERFAEFSWAAPAVPTPFVGFGPRPGRHGNANITELQLRAARDPIIPKPAGRVRILLVGGSVAYGSGAPSQDRTIGGYLEQMLKGRAEVFTLAYPWWTSSHERIAIEQRASLLEPDFVFVLTGWNDVARALAGVDVRWMRTPVDAFYFRALSQDHALHDVVPAPAATPPSPETVAERFKGNMLPKVGYFLQPTLVGSKKPLTAREKELLAKQPSSTVDYVARCWKALRETGLVDASDAFDETKEDVYLDLVHFADRGNERVAKRILDRFGF